MEFARINKDKIIDLYVRQGLSSYEVAEKLNTYSTRILRALDFLGIQKRGYSEAQSGALKRGRTEHPTKGKNLTEETKARIGRSRTKIWRNMSQAEYEQVKQMNKAKWDAMSEAEKAELRRKALEQCRIASRLGSKTERHLTNKLSEAGYAVEVQKTNLVTGSTLKVDLFLPEIKVAIEVDGPTHFLPIWGNDKLQKQQSADIIKQGLLINAGYALIRVRQIDKNISLTKMDDVFNAVLSILKEVENKFPEKSKRLIEIEVNDGVTKRI